MQIPSENTNHTVPTTQPDKPSTPSHTHNWIEQTHTVHHDAVYGTRWIEDTPAWDETVSDGYKCSGCGATK